MRYWPFYGDRWVAKTVSLSPMREGLYLRLIVWMMTQERPLPPSIADVCTIARTQNSAQAKAVEDLLGLYFTQAEDGYWHQKTADEVLEWWTTTGKVRNAKHVDGTRSRVKELRSRIAEMAEALRKKGVKVNSRMGINEVRRLCVENDVTPDVTPDDVTRNAKRTTLRNALIQNSNNKSVTHCARNGVTSPAEGGSLDPWESRKPGPLTRAARAVQAAELDDFNASHPRFVALVGKVDDATFRNTATEAKVRGKSFAWMLGAIEGRLADAAARPLNGPTSADRGQVEGLVPADHAEALRKRLHDPSVADPWDLPPSPTEDQPTNGINDLAAHSTDEL